MLARLQQLTTLGLLAAALAWACAALVRGEVMVALAGSLLIVLGYAVVLGIEFIWMYLANQRDSFPGPGLSETLAAWWGEVRSAPLVFCWQQPFRSRAHPDRLEGAAAQRGVLLVHGFVCNRGLWNPWFERLTQADIPHVAVNLEPVFGDIDLYGPAIEAAVQALMQRTGMPPLIVAHSMGGLAVRAWLGGQDEASALARVHHVITLGSPHQGTLLARFGMTPNAQQMRRENNWLVALSRRESLPLRRKFTCLFSRCDNIVFPTSTAILPGAQAIAVPGCAHVHMVVHPAAFEAVMAQLKPLASVCPASNQDPTTAD